MTAPEQIVKSLRHRGIFIALANPGNGASTSDLILRGRTRGLTDADRDELRKHKPEIVHYLSEMSSTSAALYVAADLEHWITDEPCIWADHVTIGGKQYVKLTPEVIAWFKAQIAKAEAACDAGKLPPEDYGRIVRAFCAVYEFAICAGMVPNPAAQARQMQEAR